MILPPTSGNKRHQKTLRSLWPIGGLLENMFQKGNGMLVPSLPCGCELSHHGVTVALERLLNSFRFYLLVSGNNLTNIPQTFHL